MWYSCFPNVALLPWEFLANLTWEEDCYTAELHGLEDITNEDAPNFGQRWCLVCFRGGRRRSVCSGYLNFPEPVETMIIMFDIQQSNNNNNKQQSNNNNNKQQSYNKQHQQQQLQQHSIVKTIGTMFRRTSNRVGCTCSGVAKATYPL